MDGGFIPQQKKERLKPTAFFTPFSNRRFKPQMPCGWYVSDFSGRGSQIGTQASTGGLLWMITLGEEILKGIGCDEIIVLIVLIVHIVTVCLNEAKPFSLFNATQILGISNWETQVEKSAVVFIVLIVLIVTRYLNEAMCFSLFNATQILGVPVMENHAVIFIVLIATRCLSDAMPLFFV